MSADRIQQIYIALFNRPADPVGLNFWLGQTNQGTDLAPMLDVLAPLPEYQDRFSDLSDAQKINSIYQALFGRDADVEGLTYFTGQLSAGALTLATLAVNVLDGAQGSDATIIANKVTASTSFTEALDTGAEVLAYDGAAAITAATAYLSGITSDAATIPDATATAAAVTAMVASYSGATGSTFTLTTGTDNRSGTTGNDTFDASLSNGAQTLGAFDRLDGGAGADILNASITGSVTPASLSNIETLNVTNTGAGSILGLSNATGLTAVNSTASTAALTISGVGAGVAVGIADSAANHTVVYSGVTGSTDSASISLTNVSGGTLTAAGIETLTLNSGGAANTLTALTAADTSKLVVTGAQNLTITNDLTTNVTSVDASKASGSINVDLDAVSATVVGGSGNDDLTIDGAGTASVVGGVGDDTVTFAAGAFTVADTVSGGDGTDILAGVSADFEAADGTAPTTRIVTSIERLRVTDEVTAGAAFTVNNIAENVAVVDFANASAAAGDDVTDGAAQVIGAVSSLTVNLGGTAAGNAADLQGTLTVTDTGVGTSDSATIVNNAVNSTTGLNIDVFSGENISSQGYESLTLNVGTTLIDNTIGTITVTGDTGGTSAETVNFVGAGRVSAGVITADIVNATGLTATTGTVLDMVTNSTATVVTGSGGNDDLHGNRTLASTIDGGAGSDTVTGGSGNDVLSGGAGNDTISAIDGGSDSIDGGAGNDTVAMGASLSSGDTVVGGDGVDTLSITAAVTSGDAGSRVSGFERLETTATSQDMAVFTNNTFDRVNAENASVTLSNVGSSTNTVAVDNTATTLLSVDRLVDVSSNALTLLATGAVNLATLIANDEETLTVDSNDGAVTVTTANLSDLTKLVVQGDNNVAITNALVGATALAAIDAAGLSGATTTLSVNAATSNAGITFTAGTNGGQTTLVTGGGNDTINATVGVLSVTAGGGSDTVTGSAGVDTIDGGGGADSMSGGTGNDRYVFQSDAAVGDMIVDSAGQGTADMIFTVGNVNISNLAVNGGVAGGDLLGSSGAGIENIVITTGTTLTVTGEQLSGNAINIAESAGGTTNLIVTATGSADLSSLTFNAAGFSAFDDNGDTITVNGNGDANVITGASISATINGNGGNDVITAGSSGDTINGGDGADVINAGAGADFINGGAGSDTINLTGSAASVDTVLYTARTDAGDSVTGFSTAVDDILSFTEASFINGNAGTKAVVGTGTGAGAFDLNTANFKGIVEIGDDANAGFTNVHTLVGAATTNVAADDAFIFLIDNGVSTNVYAWDDRAAAGGDGGGDFDAGEFLLLAQLVGVTDATAFDAADLVIA